MKKTIALILALVIALSVFAVAPITTSAAEVDSAQTGEYITSYDGEYVYRVLPDGTAEICDYLVEEEQDYLYITSYIDGYDVTSIGYGAFGYLPCKEVHIPDTVTKIDSNAFIWSGVESVVIPESVQELGLCAFYECASLKEITFENPNCKIDDYAETIPSGAVIYGYPNSTAQAFAEKNNRKFMTGFLYQVLADGTAEITGYLGYETDIVIPSKIDGYTVTSIGDFSFIYNETITSVTMPDTVTRIGLCAFDDCSNLKEVELSDSLTFLGQQAFYYCESLKTIDLPESLVTIDRMAFYHSGLTEVVIPDSVETMGSEAFDYCANLTSVTIGKSLTVLEEEVFACCDNLTSVVIPSNIVEIGKYAFASCINLEKITIGENVKSIYYDTFHNCPKLTTMIVYSKDCEMYSGYYSPYYNYEGRHITFYGYTGSTAEQLVNRYNSYTPGYHTFIPLDKPTEAPTEAPTVAPTVNPTAPVTEPTEAPTVAPTVNPTAPVTEPTEAPTEKPEIVRPEKVENFHAEEITNNSFTLAWDPVEGASFYVVYNMVNGMKYKSTPDTSLVIPDRKVGTTYKYAVVAVFEDGSMMDLSKADVLELEVEAYIKNLRVIDVDKFSATIEWDEIEGAEYLIYVGEGLFMRTTEPYAVVNNRDPDTQYYIRVIAFFPGRPEYEQFALKDAKGVTIVTDPLGEITSKTSLNIPIPDEVKEADWNDAKGAYNAWIMFGTTKENVASKDRFYDFSVDSYKVSDLEYGTEYYYSFRYFKDGKRVDTPVMSMKTIENDSFDDITVTFTDEGKAVINWNVVNGATMYWVYVDGVKVSKQADNSAVTIDKYKDGATVTIKSQYEYKENRFKMFDYEPTTIKKP